MTLLMLFMGVVLTFLVGALIAIALDKRDMPVKSMGLSVGLFVLFGLYADVYGVNENYATGTMSGRVVQLQHGGIMFKTWDGELHMGATKRDKTVNVAEYFTILDPEVLEQVRSLVNTNKEVTLHYKEWFISPLSYGDDTVITGVTSVAE